MELSGLELRYLINEAKSKISSEYYVSDIIPVTESALLFKLHHSREPDIMLMISTQGLWITTTRFKTIEENPMVNILTREIERSKIVSLEQMGSERIFMVKFRRNDDTERILVVEIFGNGNMILCDAAMTILGLQRAIEVRHRTLRVGLKYVFPPKRGEDVFNMSLEHLLTSKHTVQSDESSVVKWLGTCTSMPKKFVDEVIRRSGIQPTATVNQLDDIELQSIYTNIMEVVSDVVTGKNHDPAILTDSSGNALDAFPIRIYDDKNPEIRKVSTFMDAIDYVLGNQILKFAKSQKTMNLDKQMADIKHDLEQQEKAKEEVIIRANSLRNLAKDLMALSQQGLFKLEDTEFDTVLVKHHSRIVKEKGEQYIEVADQFIPVTPSFPTLASYLFTRAKELERGIDTIEEASQKIRSKIQQLHDKTMDVEKKIEFKKQEQKEWYERYHWCFTSDGLLIVGGKDASSNSAIIRKHLTDGDIVFHAEIHGSPFFLLKKGKDKLDSTVDIRQVAQATVSFSRAWKEGLSSADAYWVFPSQIKKGAPSGQYLPKGSFVIEGKRNFVKNIDLKLAIGLTRLGNSRYSIICGPYEAVPERSVVHAVLIPGAVDVVGLAKKIKSEFVKILTQSEPSLVSYTKQITIDDLIKILPTGSSKILSVGKGGSFDLVQDPS